MEITCLRSGLLTLTTAAMNIVVTFSKQTAGVLVFKNPLEVTIFLGKPLVFLRSFKILVHATNPWSEGREPGRPENKRW